MNTLRHSEIMNAHIRVLNFRNLRRLDWILVLLVLCLAGIGIMTLFSANRSVTWGTPFYQKQMIFLGMGCFLALCVACFDHRFLVSLAPLLYLGSIVLLVLVLFIGKEVKGGQRWIDLGFFSLQPSELSKLGLIFMLTWYFKKIGSNIQRLPWFLLTFAIAAIPGMLILVEPNLGTTATLAPLVFSMLFVVGARRAHMVGLIFTGLACAPIAWTRLQPYQQQRVLSFFDPGADPTGSGYHTIQSMITVGSGGMGGKGYMEGTQTFLSYLPEHHSDFIFSLLAEEWGFVGGVGVLILFALFFLRGLWLANESEDLSGTLLSVGIIVTLAFHTIINIAITLGMLPVTGIPLPFLSYGGSFYLTTMLGIGVLLSVHARRGMFDY